MNLAVYSVYDNEYENKENRQMLFACPSGRLSACLTVYLFVPLLLCVYVCFFICLSVGLFIFCPYFVCASVCIFVCLSVHQSVCLYVCLSLRMAVCLLNCLPLCLSLCLSAFLPVRPSVVRPSVNLSACMLACLSVCSSVCMRVSMPAYLAVYLLFLNTHQRYYLLLYIQVSVWVIDCSLWRRFNVLFYIHGASYKQINIKLEHLQVCVCVCMREERFTWILLMTIGIRHFYMQPMLRDCGMASFRYKVACHCAKLYTKRSTILLKQDQHRR